MADKFAESRHGAESRALALWYDPEKLVLVTKQGEAFYDPRVHYPVDEELVASIMEHGVLVPILVAKDGQDAQGNVIVKVQEGRQRVKALREANKRLRKEGKPAWQVRGMPWAGDEMAALVEGVVVNEHRVFDGPVVRAEKMKQLADKGTSIADIARAFRRSTQNVREHLALVDCAAEVKKAVGAFTLPMSIAKTLSTLPKDEQVVQLKKMQAEGKTVGAEAHEAAAAAVGPARGKGRATPVRAVRSRAELEVTHDALMTKDNRTPTDQVIFDTLRWVLTKADKLPKEQE